MNSMFEDKFVIANSVDHDRMPHYSSVSSLFAKVPVKGFLVFKGLIVILSTIEAVSSIGYRLELHKA